MAIQFRPDPFQTAALVIAAIQIIFIGLYYVYYAQQDGMYVSDLLFTIAPYKVLMTIFVVLQALLCFMFILRLYAYSKWLFWIETSSLLACIVGWITLNTKYLNSDADKTTSDTHRYGTLVFMLGTVGYFVCLVYTTRSAIRNICEDFWVGMCAIMAALLLVITLILGAIFVRSLFAGDSGGWIYEHSAFMTIVLAHVFFFCIESPNPWLPFEHSDYTRIKH